LRYILTAKFVALCVALDSISFIFFSGLPFIMKFAKFEACPQLSRIKQICSEISENRTKLQKCVLTLYSCTVLLYLLD